MKILTTFSLCFSIAVANTLLIGAPALADEPFEDCLEAADGLFRDGSDSELAAIRACQGTAQPNEVADCIDLVDSLWRNGSASEVAGLEACQSYRPLRFERNPELFDEGAYATCLRRAESSTRDDSPEEIASIQACRGLTQPEEVGPCLDLADSLWRNDSEPELAGLSACQVSFY
ncbi:MAG: hypothetical protein AAF152_14680 [Cyanobacteria bacterium P01_A01_bin.114]